MHIIEMDISFGQKFVVRLIDSDKANYFWKTNSIILNSLRGFTD
ncbi:hypothetical protein PL8927_140048 [Planktothrix serta PCC 8927]|uniref:Uncharacterized protein n=1 Tax=Planktothrix serta PCC 8927 TaxID=671068 RepID=A0A7Z9BF12_9CYAN|nr:hypothetical protein PL8927_140048 [Planktothrix serta PCC 8927]